MSKWDSRNRRAARLGITGRGDRIRIEGLDRAPRFGNSRSARGQRFTARGHATVGALLSLPALAALCSIQLASEAPAGPPAPPTYALAAASVEPRVLDAIDRAVAGPPETEASPAVLARDAAAPAPASAVRSAAPRSAPSAQAASKPAPQRVAARAAAPTQASPRSAAVSASASPGAVEALLGRVPHFEPERVERALELGNRLSETIAARELAGGDRLRVDYAFDPELLRGVQRVLRRDRAPRAHVVAMDVETGRILAFASSDPENFPPHRAYPAASLVKIVTAAAAIDHAPRLARSTCRYTGSPWRLTRSRVDPPRKGKEASLERALSTSNNQCFAQLAVHGLGAERMLNAVRRFGWLDAPAPGHEPGLASAGDDAYTLGKLGSGLAGSRITPLHAVQLAASLADGEIVEPWWVERVTNGRGKALPLPERGTRRRAMSSKHARELRSMLVETTRSGTARKGFRLGSGRSKLGGLSVAGKTGTLSARDSSVPRGRYEWFAGIAPADHPRIAIAVVQLQGDLWWSTSSQVAADVLREIFCEEGRCAASLASRFDDHTRLAMASRVQGRFP